MNKFEIEIRLNELVGQEYSSYSWDNKAFNALKPALQDLGFNVGWTSGSDKYISYKTYKNGGQTMYLTYRGYTVATISVSKKKGKYTGNYWGRSYDWTIAGFEAAIYHNNNGEEETIENRIKEIDEIVNKNIAAKNDEKIKMATIAKNLMATGLTYNEMRNFCQYVEKNRYNSEFQRLCTESV